MNLPPNLSLIANMGYLLLLILKDLFTRISKPKNVLKYVYPIKRYNALKFEFPTMLLLEIIKTQILKRYISENVPLFAQVRKWVPASLMPGVTLQ